MAAFVWYWSLRYKSPKVRCGSAGKGLYVASIAGKTSGNLVSVTSGLDEQMSDETYLLFWGYIHRDWKTILLGLKMWYWGD